MPTLWLKADTPNPSINTLALISFKSSIEAADALLELIGSRAFSSRLAMLQTGSEEQQTMKRCAKKEPRKELMTLNLGSNWLIPF